MFDADSLRIPALEPIRDVEGVATAFALAAKEALVPFARSQLIPNKRGNTARFADDKPVGL